MKNSRLLKILYLLSDHQKVTAIRLAQHFEVSTRTILRDMDALLVAGFPVDVIRGRDGGFFLDHRDVLDKALLSVQETQTLTSLVQSLKVLPMEQTQLHYLFPDNGWFEYDFSGWTRSDKRLFAIIRQHIQAHRSLDFFYYNSRGDYSLRHVLPAKLVYKDRFWYLSAKDEVADDMRFFKLRRIVIDRLEPTYDPSLITITMEVNRLQIFKILDECTIHEIHHQDQKQCRVVFSCPLNAWVYDFILSLGD